MKIKKIVSFLVSVSIIIGLFSGVSVYAAGGPEAYVLKAADMDSTGIPIRFINAGGISPLCRTVDEVRVTVPGIDYEVLDINNFNLGNGRLLNRILFNIPEPVKSMNVERIGIVYSTESQALSNGKFLLYTGRGTSTADAEECDTSIAEVTSTHTGGITTTAEIKIDASSFNENAAYLNIYIEEAWLSGKGFGYIHEIKFYPEGYIDEYLSYPQTVPAQNVNFSQNQVKLDFNLPVNLESAKSNIEFYKEGEKLTEGEDEDYTLSISNDKTVLIDFENDSPVYVDYQVIVKKELNSNLEDFIGFDETITDDFVLNFQGISAEAPQKYEWDFNELTEVPQAFKDAQGNSGINASGLSIEEVDGQKVLKFSNEKTADENRQLKLLLPEAIDLTSGTVTVEFTAKLPKAQTSLGMYGDAKQWNWNNNTTQVLTGEQKASTLGYVMYGKDGDPVTAFVDSNNFQVFVANVPDSEKTTLTNKIATEKYNSYKFVIDNRTHTQKIYIKGQGIDYWCELMPNIKIYTNKYYNTDLTTFRTDTELHRGKVNELTSLKYLTFDFSNKFGTSAQDTESFLFKDFKITQNISVSASDVADAEQDVSDELSDIDILMSTKVDVNSVNKENISIVRIEDGKEFSDVSYTVASTNNGKRIKIGLPEKLLMGTEYRIKIKNLVSSFDANDVMPTETVINFATAKKYGLIECTAEDSGNNIEVGGKLKLYYKASGENYAVVAVLVKNGNTYCGVKYLTGTASAATSGFVTPDYSFSFTKPSEYNSADYSVRIYAIDGIKDSITQCKNVEISLSE